MTTTFENAVVGDQVWSTLHGYGTIVEIKESSTCQIVAKFEDDDAYSFTANGQHIATSARSLFWDETNLTLPEKQIKLLDYEIDTLLVVGEIHFRYFSYFDEEDNCYCFSEGFTSYTNIYNSFIPWSKHRLPTEEEIKQKKVIPQSRK